MHKTFDNIRRFFKDLPELDYVADYFIEDMYGEENMVWCCVLLLDMQSIVRTSLHVESLGDAQVLRAVALFLASEIPVAVGVMRNDQPVILTVYHTTKEEYLVPTAG